MKVMIQVTADSKRMNDRNERKYPFSPANLLLLSPYSLVLVMAQMFGNSVIASFASSLAWSFVCISL